MNGATPERAVIGCRGQVRLFDIRFAIEGCMKRVTRNTQHPIKARKGMTKLLENACGRFGFDFSTGVYRTDIVSGKRARLDIVWMHEGQIKVAIIFGNTMRTRSINALDNMNIPLKIWCYTGVLDPPQGVPENLIFLRPDHAYRQHTGREWRWTQSKPRLLYKQFKHHEYVTFRCGHQWRVKVKNPHVSEWHDELVKLENSDCPTCERNFILPDDYFVLEPVHIHYDRLKPVRWPRLPSKKEMLSQEKKNSGLLLD